MSTLLDYKRNQCLCRKFEICSKSIENKIKIYYNPMNSYNYVLGMVKAIPHSPWKYWLIQDLVYDLR